MNEREPGQRPLPETPDGGGPKKGSAVEYAAAVASSSSRARGVIIVLVVCTVMLTFQVRNSVHPWHEDRIRVRSDALKLIDAKVNLGDVTEEQLVQCVRTEKDKVKSDCQAKLFLKRRGYDGAPFERERYNEELESYRKIAIEEISYFSLPFFGVVGDNNDIGMFAGFAFTVVMLWLRFSLARELANLKLVVNNPLLKGDFTRCYELIAMQQLLSVPPMPYASTQHRWRWVRLVLYSMPLPVYFLHLIYDSHSMRRVGETLGAVKAWFALSTSWAFFVLMVFLVLWCIRISQEIDGVWWQAAHQAYPDKFPLPGE